MSAPNLRHLLVLRSQRYQKALPAQTRRRSKRRSTADAPRSIANITHALRLSSISVLFFGIGFNMVSVPKRQPSISPSAPPPFRMIRRPHRVPQQPSPDTLILIQSPTPSPCYEPSVPGAILPCRLMQRYRQIPVHTAQNGISLSKVAFI